MADLKITDLTELSSSLDQDDLLVVVDDPSGTPVTKKSKTRHVRGTRYFMITVFSTRDLEPCETGDGKHKFHVPPDLNGLDLVYVHAFVDTAGTTGTMDIQLYNVTQAADMLTTKLTIDSGETGSDTAATPAVIDTANDDIATNDIIRIDIDAVHTTVALGLVVTLGFR